MYDTHVFSSIRLALLRVTKGIVFDVWQVLQFLKGFTDEQRHKLALYTGLVISGGIAPASALCKLLSEHLVKPGLALTFMTNVLKTWLGEKDMTSVGGALKKAGLNSKLLVSYLVVCETFVS